jgi:hypothetical protein
MFEIRYSLLGTGSFQDYGISYRIFFHFRSIFDTDKIATAKSGYVRIGNRHAFGTNGSKLTRSVIEIPAVKSI